MQQAYDDNQVAKATAIFHEIELLLYEDQLFPSFGYSYNPDSAYQYTTKGFIINCGEDSPLHDLNLRWALSYLVDREFYTATIGTEDAILSHIFEWSQYHDDSLPEITYSIGKAKSTLAKAGYRPQAIQ